MKFFSKTKKKKNKKSNVQKKKKPNLNNEVVDWVGLGLASCCPNQSKIKQREQNEDEAQ